MNPLTNVRNITAMNEKELQLGYVNTNKSWHRQYKDSAWIFIGGLNFDLTEGDIICVFSQFGEVINIDVIRDPKTGKSRGFAFLYYEDQRSTILAVDNLNGVKVTGRIIRVDHVENYKPPKSSGTQTDGIHKWEGCGPEVMMRVYGEKPQTTTETEVNERKKKKKKKEKKKKKKKRKKTVEESNESDSSESSESVDALQPSTSQPHGRSSAEGGRKHLSNDSPIRGGSPFHRSSSRDRNRRQTSSYRFQREDEFSPDDQPFIRRDRRVSPYDQRVSSRDRRLLPRDRQLSPRDRRVSPHDRRRLPRDQEVSPHDRLLSSRDRRVSPRDRRRSSHDRWESPRDRRESQRQRQVWPRDEDISPPNHGDQYERSESPPKVESRRRWRSPHEAKCNSPYESDLNYKRPRSRSPFERRH